MTAAIKRASLWKRLTKRFTKRLTKTLKRRRNGIGINENGKIQNKKVPEGHRDGILSELDCQEASGKKKSEQILDQSGDVFLGLSAQKSGGDAVVTTVKLARFNDIGAAAIGVTPD